LSAVLLLAALLRFWDLGKQPLWLDEATTAMFAARDFPDCFFAEAQHPPLFYAMEYFALRWFGDTEAGLRILPALFGVLGVWATWTLARRLFPREENVARLAALLAAASPYLIYMSQEARSYSLVILLSLLATNYFWRFAIEHDPGRPGAQYEVKRDLVIYSLLALALIWTHYFTVWLLLAHEIVYWRCSRIRPFTWVATRVMTAAFFIGWVWWAIFRLNLGGAAWIRSPLSMVPLALLRYLVGFGIAAPTQIRLTQPWQQAVREEGPAVLLIAGPLLVAMSLGVRALWRRRETGASAAAPDTPLRTLFFGVLVLPVLVLASLSPIMSLLHDRNLAFQAPFVLLLIALGLTSLRGSWRQIGLSATAVAVTCALLTYYAAPVGEEKRSVLGYELRYGKEDWPGAAAYVRAANPDAVILAPAYIRIPFERYWAAPPPKIVKFHYGVVDSGGVPYVGDARRVVLVLSHESSEEEGLSGRGGLGRDRPLFAQKHFLQQSGIRVFVYDAPDKPQQGSQK